MEIERARLTRQLARMKEEEGAIAEAAEILQEVAVVSAGGCACCVLLIGGHVCACRGGIAGVAELLYGWIEHRRPTQAASSCNMP